LECNTCNLGSTHPGLENNEYLGFLMDVKKKNILTAIVLIIVAAGIYVFAVIRALSQ